MKILSVKIHNILSIENAEILFEDTGLVLVEGWNYDLGRANGAGKSAIFNAISFAIYDKVPRKITASEILRRGTSKGFSECRVLLADAVYTVRRTRPKGVQFFKNDQPIDITQEEWERKIRLSYFQFLISVYCSQKGNNRFLDLNDSDKKNFLLQLLDLDQFQELKRAADSESRCLSDEIINISNEIASQQSKIEAYKESLVNESDVNRELAELRNKIKKYDEKIISLQNIQKPDLSNYVKLSNQLDLKIQNFVAARSVKTVYHNQYRQLLSSQVDFSGSDTCDSCGSVLDISEAKEHHKKEQLKIETELKNLKQKIDEQDNILSKENEIYNLRKKLDEKKKVETEEYTKAQSSITELKMASQKISILIENYVIKLSNNKTLFNKINALEESNNKLNIDHAKKIKDLEFYKVLSAMYSPTGAQAYVLDSIIDSFNEVVKDYINLVWPTATYVLNSYKENSKGDITAKFSECLTINGDEVSVGSLSGGEARAISLCVDFAIMDVMQNNFGIKINPTILDEPFDGLDAIGKELIIDLLEKISTDRQIFVIDHSSEAKAMFTKIITVELKNKISTVKIDF